MEATTGAPRRKIFSTTALHNLPLIASRMSRQRSERFQFWSTILKSYIWMRRWTRNRLPSFGVTTTFWWKLKTSPRSRRRSQMLWWTSRCNNGLLFSLVWTTLKTSLDFTVSMSLNICVSCWRFRGKDGTTSTSSLEWTLTSFKIIISSRCSERTLCKSSISCLVKYPF